MRGFFIAFFLYRIKILYMSKPLLTIGMSTYDDYDGVFFSIQSLRMHHDVCKNNVEFIVLDNNPYGSHGAALKTFLQTINGKYIPYSEKKSSFNKYLIPDYASGKYIVIMDSHVLLIQNALTKLLEYYEKNPNCKNLVQGPLIYDDLVNISTHFDPVWRGDMYGIWATNLEAFKKGEPFEIPMQGMGLMSFEKDAWVGINPRFTGFGAEEGYIAEKFRLHGGKNICIPQLGWMHRFNRPNGVAYPLALEDRIWNYFVGWYELYNDPQHKMIKETYEHFKDKIPFGRIDQIQQKALSGMQNWR